MQGVSKVRATTGPWAVMGAAILAALFTLGGAPPTFAQTAAPIVYKLASPTTPPAMRFETSVAPVAIKVAPHAPIPSFSTASSLVPINASFGPAAPTPVSRNVASSPLMSAPSSQAGVVSPYAGPPYQVAGKWYVPTYEPNYDEVGTASWYGPTFHGKDAASGEVFDEMAMTAAHPTLPLPSLVRVTNLENGKSVVVRLNDRGPFVDDRIIDLSRAAGAALDMYAKGTAKVRVQYVGPAPVSADTPPVKTSAPKAASKPDIASMPLSPVAAPAAKLAAPLGGSLPQQRYFLQAGSFADLANANALRDRLRADGPASIVAVSVNGSDYYRVMIGP
jgi:rare lipoprotein A